MSSPTAVVLGFNSRLTDHGQGKKKNNPLTNKTSRFQLKVSPKLRPSMLDELVKERSGISQIEILRYDVSYMAVYPMELISLEGSTIIKPLTDLCECIIHESISNAVHTLTKKQNCGLVCGAAKVAL